MPGLFDEDLAAIHAVGVAPATDPGYAWLIAMGRAAAVGSGRNPSLFDIGCGDGRWMAAARAAGFRAAGCDLSAACVAMARARGLDVARADAAEATVPAADLVTALGEVLAFADRHDRAPLAAAAARVAARLRPGAWLILDLPGPDMARAAGAPAEESAGEDWRLRRHARLDGAILVREIETERRVRGVWRRRRTEHRLRLFHPDEAVTILSEAGFDSRAIDRWGDLALPEGRIGYAARRRE